ncbi:MAG: malto-oligosyltrehalose synthase [Euzebya sp.]
MTDATLIPTSTYRLHLTYHFTLDDAAQMVDYTDALGVDWLYASPIQTVPVGATHGYHITDPLTVNPELGGEEALRRLRDKLAGSGRRLVLDIVPNHLAASVDNPWWVEVLAAGPESAYAPVFDIDFDAGPIVLPVLGEPVEQAIAQQSLRIQDGRLAYHDLRLPLAAGTDTTAPLQDVLDAQHYRLHQWQHGETILNWRRFFAVNELVGVRVEDPDVFESTHSAILRWIDEGLVHGLRVDHIDGLADPALYLQTLRDRIGDNHWLVVEKIVEGDEALPTDWPVHGTTGYETGIMLYAWLLDPTGYDQLRQDFWQVSELPDGTAAALPASKLAVLDSLFVAEVNRIAQLLGDVPDPPPVQARVDGVRHLTAHLRGYRTYAPPSGPLTPEDRTAIQQAATAAEQAGALEAVSVAQALMTEEGRDGLLRWQQLSGPAAAKGFEDRLLYRHVALAGLSEVGADAGLLDRLPTSGEIAAAMVRRAGTTPAAGSTTSTHDTKRSEDVRARLAVLAEIPGEFTALLTSVTDHLTGHAPTLDGHTRWLLIQTVLGTLDLVPSGDVDYLQRLQEYATKALREAELHTSHRDPDPAYEQAVSEWLDALLSPGPARDAVSDLVERIALPGACNSLALLLLKIAAPGVADIYRGCEVWDDALVDPDNRRPLDLTRLRGLLDGLDSPQPSEVLERWRDGAVKMHLTRQGLLARRRLPEVFLSTRCDSPAVTGRRADHVVCLHRWASDRGLFAVTEPAGSPTIIALAPRLPLTLAEGAWPLGEVWQDTWISAGAGRYHATNLLTGAEVPINEGRITLADATTTLPVALLELT